jgi:DNA-directed RNA polymerase subunit RPC12/RpoP/gluconate kinase
MIDICPKCGNYKWDKEISVDKKQIACPECGHHWNFKALPLFILTGCSGVGKTTTAQELLSRDTGFLVMDADFLYNLLPHSSEEDYHNWIEQVMSLFKNIMQGGRPLLWTLAGALEHFETTYNRRFFTEIYYLALVCDKDALEKRMREGRKITDENWIQSSADYNQWFINNGMIAGHRIGTYDITGKSVSQVADYVQAWINLKLSS